MTPRREISVYLSFGLRTSGPLACHNSSRPAKLIDIAKYFATNVLYLGFLVRHHSFRSRDDRYTQTILHTLELSRAGVCTQTRTADPFKGLDRRFFSSRII